MQEEARGGLKAQCVPAYGTAGAWGCWRDSTEVKFSLAGREHRRQARVVIRSTRVGLWPKGDPKCLNQETAVSPILGVGYTQATKN